MPLFFVMVGGALGAGLRYQVGRLSLSLFGPGFPWGTWFINLSGGLFMGLLVGLLARSASPAGESWRLLVGVGVLGGYTTFSTAMVDVQQLVRAGRPLLGLAYLGGTAIAAVLAAAVGAAVVRGAAVLLHRRGPDR